MLPLVSIIIPVFNGSNYLHEAMIIGDFVVHPVPVLTGTVGDNTYDNGYIYMQDITIHICGKLYSVNNVDE